MSYDQKEIDGYKSAFKNLVEIVPDNFRLVIDDVMKRVRKSQPLNGFADHSFLSAMVVLFCYGMMHGDKSGLAVRGIDIYNKALIALEEAKKKPSAPSGSKKVNINTEKIWN